MSQELYYEAPSDEIFQEVKKEAIKIWETYDDTYGYATEKIDRIKDLENIRDNFMYLWAMLDNNNQVKLFANISEEARDAFVERYN